MEKKYKLAVILNIIPAMINILASVYLFFNFSPMQFSGYVTGTILGIILSAIWLIQVRKAFGSHAVKLLKITFKGFFVKIVLFIIFIIGVYNLFTFSRIFFAISFFIALLLSAVIELWFYASLINDNDKKG